VIDDVRDAGEGFGVVDRGRFAVQTKGRGKRRLEARLAFLALDGFQQGGFFAADVGAIAEMIMQVEAEIRAQDVVAEIAGGARQLAGLFHALVGLENFAMHIVVAGLDPHRIGGDRHALDEQMRVVAQDVPVLAGAWLALVGIADDIFVPGVIFRHEAPLQPGREARTAASAQCRQLDFGNNRIGRHFFGQHLAQCLVTADL